MRDLCEVVLRKEEFNIHLTIKVPEMFGLSDIMLYLCTMETHLNFSDIPSKWPICLQADCPLATTCLRHHAAQLAPAELRHHECVLPGARTADGCHSFVEDKPVRLARGMTCLLPRITTEEGMALRQQLYALFGSTSQFYRYRRGRWLISPRLQARVEALFRKHGYKTDKLFDEYTEGYYFGQDT